LRGKTVVRRKDQQLRREQLGPLTAQDQAQPYRKRLEPAKRALRLGLGIQITTQPGFEVELPKRLDRRDRERCVRGNSP